jgi:hypothetical protein
MVTWSPLRALGYPGQLPLVVLELRYKLSVWTMTELALAPAGDTMSPIPASEQAAIAAPVITLPNILIVLGVFAMRTNSLSCRQGN